MTVAENIGTAMKKKWDEKKKEIDRLFEQFAPSEPFGGRMPNEFIRRSAAEGSTGSNSCQ